jgi:hypothetical protein
MIGAAMSRRAGSRPAATALVLAFALACAAGCASHPAPRPTDRAQPGALMVAQGSPLIPASLPHVHGGLPSPVVLRTASGAYVIGRSGAIRRIRPAQRLRAQVHHPAGFVWVNRRAGIWAMMRRGHVLIVRNRTVIWRSAQRYRVQDAAHMGVIVAGRPGIALGVHQFGPVFMARWSGPEHRVVAAGWPEMWTRSGNLIVVLHRRGSKTFGYAVFSPSGTRLATLSTGLSVNVADQRDDDLGTGTFWYLAENGDLIRTDGVTTTVVANIRAVGLTGIPEVLILDGGLIQVLSAHWRQGQVILHQDGRVFARIPSPKGQASGFGQLSVSPRNAVVAYILTTSSGRSTVFIVRPGGSAQAVYRTARGSSPCALPPLAWHGSWLLYTPQRGQPVLIDIAGGHRIIRLPATLPGSDGRPVRVRAAAWQ